MVVHTPNPISGQKMESLIEKLIEENKKPPRPMRQTDTRPGTRRC